MIVFDLKCPAGHIFEVWFGSTADYETQRDRGLVECPLCGSREIGKAVMAPAVPVKGNRRSDIPAPSPAAGTTLAGEPERVKTMMQALARIQAEMVAKADYVGHRFADEARAIHLGETQERGIYGEASPEQVNSLLEDGISIAPLLFPVRKPDA